MQSVTIRLNPQSGAMFGLDARIALAVFSLLAVVAGVAMVVNLADSRAKGLAAELAETSKAVEAFHSDVKDDIFMVLEEPSEARAFQALYDHAVVREDNNYRARWNGPYVRAVTNIHTEFGEMSLQKRMNTHAQRCDTGEEGLCFLWLVYGRVKPNIVAEVNQLFDGNEQNPATQGRVQWSQDVDATQILYFRLVKALVAE